jgi:hypothetical protein
MSACALLLGWGNTFFAVFLYRCFAAFAVLLLSLFSCAVILPLFCCFRCFLVPLFCCFRCCAVVLLLSKVLTVCWIGHRDVVVLNLLSGINTRQVHGGSTRRETHPSLGTTILQNASTGSRKVSKRVGLSHWPRTCATAPCLFYCNANEKQP